MAVAEISIEPLGTTSPSISDLVTACVSVLKNEPNIKFDVTAMGTIIEGDRHQIMSLAERMQDACFRAGAERVITNIRIDDRHDKAMSMQQMEQKVEQQIGRGPGSSERMMGM